MIRYVFYIVTSVFVTIMGLCFLWYVLWDVGQPKTGPIGNGVPKLTFVDLLPIYSIILLGLVNLPVAIMGYRDYKRTQEQDDKQNEIEFIKDGRYEMDAIQQSGKNEERSIISMLETVDVNSGERTVLAEFDFLIEAPNWTKDGKQLIYNSGGLLYTFDLDSRESKLIESGYANHCNNDHVLSPDNTQLAVSHHTKEDGKSRIYVFSLAAGQPALITPLAPSYLHGWSPDGNTLAYCAERNGEYNIYTIPVGGGNETQLTNTSGLDDGPEYSPDGRHIWFNSTRSGLMQVWRMNVDGSDQTQMTFDESNSWFPHVSPDGETIAYLTYRKGDVAPNDHPANKDVEIRLMASNGGPHQVLIHLFGGQGTINVNSWSPDSRQLAFVSYK